MSDREQTALAIAERAEAQLVDASIALEAAVTHDQAADEKVALAGLYRDEAREALDRALAEAARTRRLLKWTAALLLAWFGLELLFR